MANGIFVDSVSDDDMLHKLEKEWQAGGEERSSFSQVKVLFEIWLYLEKSIVRVEIRRGPRAAKSSEIVRARCTNHEQTNAFSTFFLSPHLGRPSAK